MKKMMLLGVLAAMFIFAGGCCGPSRGRISVVAWDSRKAPELEASKYMEGLVYGSADQPLESREDTEPRVFAWAILFQQLFSFKGSIKVLNVEWDTTDQNNKKISCSPVSIK